MRMSDLGIPPVVTVIFIILGVIGLVVTIIQAIIQVM